MTPCSLPGQHRKASAGDLNVMLRRVEAGTDPAYDLAVDYDRKTALHFDEVMGGHSRGSAVVDGVLQGLARFFEQRCRSGFAWCQLRACNIGRVIHPQQ